MDYICAKCGAEFSAADDAGSADGSGANCPECGYSTAGEEASQDRLEGPPVKQEPAPGIDQPRENTRPPASQGPSVIIDMGQLAESADEDDADEDAVDDSFDEHAYEQEIRATKVAFAPLSSTGAMPVVSDEVLELHKAAPAALPTEDPGEITDIKPPSIARMGFVGILLVLVVFIAFVSWRNDWNWDVLQEAPDEAIGVAFGFKEPTPEVLPPRPTVRRAEPMRGAMSFVDLRLELVSGERGSKVAVVNGKLVNNTNRIQKSIRLEVSAVAPPGTAIKKRIIQCCEVIAPDTVATVAKTADHPHFAPNQPDRLVRLVPGESRPFTVLIPQIDSKYTAQPLTPKVSVRFSEPERVAP